MQKWYCFKKKIKKNKYFLTLPVILVLLIRATIKITWSCFIVHHAQVFQVWKAHGYSLYKSAQICNFIVVYPQNVKWPNYRKFNMTSEIIVIQNQCIQIVSVSQKLEVPMIGY